MDATLPILVPINDFDMELLPLTALRLLGYLPFYLEKLPESDYSARLDMLSGASVGAHTRHILDGYRCLMKGRASGNIDYDRRQRDPALESSPEAAGLALGEIRAYLGNHLQDGPCTVSWNYGQGLQTVNSSIYREIAHNMEHTIHHLAIIKIALSAHFGWKDIPVGFGVAPSTLAYRESIGLNAASVQPCTPANR